MSAYGINKVCYLAQADLRFREQLRSDPAAALEELPLTDAERQALLAGDVAALHRMGGQDFLLSNLARFGSFGLTRDLYVERMRTLLTDSPP
jgi:hypothetical protein